MGGTANLECTGCCARCPYCIDGTIPNPLPITFASVQQGGGELEDCDCADYYNGRLYGLPFTGGDITCVWAQNFIPCDRFLPDRVDFIQAGVVDAVGEFVHLQGFIRSIYATPTVRWGLDVASGEIDKIDCGERYELVWENHIFAGTCRWDSAIFIFNPSEGDLSGDVGTATATGSV